MKQMVLIAACLMAAPAAAEPRTGIGEWTPPPAKRGFKYPDCYCTDSAGERVEIGEVACLSIGSNRKAARCDMSLNNPIWRFDRGLRCTQPGV